MQKLINVFLLVLLAVSVSACGFHLRGSLPIAQQANVIYVEGKSSDFKSDLEKRLAENGASLVANSSAAKVVLQVSEPRFERRVATIDASGKVNSYRIQYSVDYVLLDTAGEALKQKALSETRNYTFDEARILDQQREEKELIEDMNDELVLRLVRQLSRI